jgi:hypothetical protein
MDRAFSFSMLPMLARRGNLRRCIAGLMLALSAWSGMPGTACVCANGELRLFCNRQFRSLPAESDRESPTQVGSCCGGRSRANVSAIRMAQHGSSDMTVHARASGAPGHPTRCCVSMARTLFEAHSQGIALDCPTQSSSEVPIAMAVATGQMRSVHLAQQRNLPQPDLLIEHCALRI